MAKSPRILATLGPFVFAYPHLTSPDSEGQYADNKYKVDGIGEPKGPAMTAAKKAVTEACKTLGLDAKVANLPIKEETAKNDAGKREPTGKLLIRSKSQFAPAIVDASGKPIPEKVLAGLKIGAGSEGLIQGYFSSYELTEKVRENGETTVVKVPGLSFTLTGIQLIKLVKGGNQGANFAAYDGGGFTVDASDDADDCLNIGSDADDSSAADQGDGGVLDI